MRISYEDSWDEDSWEVLTHGLKLEFFSYRGNTKLLESTLKTVYSSQVGVGWAVGTRDKRIVDYL